VCDDDGKVIGVRLPCVHCWSNKFTTAVGYSSDNSITLVQSNDKLQATLYSSHTCGNWECPEVQRKFREYVDGTGAPGGKYVGKGALQDREGAVQLPAGGIAAMDQNSFETYMTTSGVKTGFLARFSSNNSKLLKKLPEDVQKKYPFWRQKAKDPETGEVNDDETEAGGTITATVGVPLAEATTETNAAFADRQSKAQELIVQDHEEAWDAFGYLLPPPPPLPQHPFPHGHVCFFMFVLRVLMRLLLAWQSSRSNAGPLGDATSSRATS
jgi:hypothetical protein